MIPLVFRNATSLSGECPSGIAAQTQHVMLGQKTTVETIFLFR